MAFRGGFGGFRGGGSGEAARGGAWGNHGGGFAGGSRFGDGGFSDRGSDAGFGRGGWGSVHDAGASTSTRTASGRVIRIITKTRRLRPIVSTSRMPCSRIASMRPTRSSRTAPIARAASRTVGRARSTITTTTAMAEAGAATVPTPDLARVSRWVRAWRRCRRRRRSQSPGIPTTTRTASITRRRADNIEWCRHRRAPWFQPRRPPVPRSISATHPNLDCGGAFYATVPTGYKGIPPPTRRDGQHIAKRRDRPEYQRHDLFYLRRPLLPAILQRQQRYLRSWSRSQVRQAFGCSHYA